VKTAVLNASPLIVLARANYLELVPKLVASAVVPRAVANEIKAGKSDDPASKFLASPRCGSVGRRLLWVTPDS
jgi:predicted nucleic acid-binding protein